MVCDVIVIVDGARVSDVDQAQLETLRGGRTRLRPDSECCTGGRCPAARASPLCGCCIVTVSQRRLIWSWGRHPAHICAHDALMLCEVHAKLWHVMTPSGV